MRHIPLSRSSSAKQTPSYAGSETPSETSRNTRGHSSRRKKSIWYKVSSRFSLKEGDDMTESIEEDDYSDYSEISLSNFFGGNLVFKSARYEDLQQDYVILDKDMSIEDLGTFMSKVWKLPTPEIVLTVISSCDYFDAGTDSDVEDFQIGLIQAARLTKMWILTEGIDAGVSRIIGEAVAQERVRRKIIEKELSRRFEDRLIVIGVVASDDLWYGESLVKSTEPVIRFGKVTLENKGDNSHELNSHHTNFLIIKCLDQADKDVKWNTRFLIESRLVQYVTSRHRSKKGILDESWRIQHQSPVVGLLVQGGPKEIDRVLWLLRKQIPVIVIKRKGYASGLLAYAYSEGVKGGDSQHLENIVKPQLMQQVMEAFPDYCQDNEVGRMNCRDKILECVKHAVQGECLYITVLDPSLRDVDQKDLNKFILTAIFNAQRDAYHTKNRENINKYLRLTLDWNSPEFAKKEIVSKMERMRFVVKDELFMEALLQPQREQFVELFLNMGFLLRRFLLGNRLLYLYEESLDNEFFVHVCLERILHKSSITLDKKFLEGSNCPLNRILFALTGLRKLTNPVQLAVAGLLHKQEEKDIAERQALLALIYWAVLTHRQALAKVLWKRTSEPIAVALVISNMYYHMSHNWILDLDLKYSVKQAAIEFGALAIEMMDLVFNDSSLMAYYSLVNPLVDFNNLNVVDIALIGNNIFFIAHPCCQRSMRARWLKRIKIKSFSWGCVKFPEYAKIYLCLFLIFPMYFWVTFTPGKRTKVRIEEDINEDIEFDDRASQEDYMRLIRKYENEDPYLSPPLWRKMYYLWTAPISKFWIYQLFLMAYMALFALALMIPYCGNKYINLILFIWTAIKSIEHCRAALQFKLKYPTFDLTWSILEILADLYICTVSGLQVSTQFNTNYPVFTHFSMDYTTYKFLMSLGILWVYFRSLRYILPVSQDLGPMLVNITQITRKDMINWLQLWLVCVVSGGLAINAVVYPVQPFTATNVWRSQLRALLGIFLTDVEDLKGDPTCSPLYDIPEVSYTCNASTIHPNIRSRLEYCPYVSLAGYLVVIQHLLLTRHVFYILMFAMFSVTTNRTQQRSVEIWKFQFYLLVTDFEKRSILPVPLTPITYPFLIGFWIVKTMFFCILKSSCCEELRKRFMAERPDVYGIPYHQWSYYMAAMTKKEEEKESHVQDILGQLEEDNAANEVMIKRLNERLVNIERNQILADFILESILNSMEATGRPQFGKTGITLPYNCKHRAVMSTLVVCWGDDSIRFYDIVQFEAYDPGTYTKPVEAFPVEFQMWIDRDILKLPVQLEEQGLVGGDESTSVLIYATIPDPVFNSIQTFKLANEKEVTINRISNLRVGDSALQYEVDSTGAPRNPMGRTGLRGRGNLWRWGPNHVIQAVISRWGSEPPGHQAAGSVGKLHTSSNKNMEILVVRESIDSNVVTLPAGRVQSIMSPHSALCNFIVKEVMQDPEWEMGLDYDQDEMIEFFARFATADMKKKKKAMYTTLGFSAFLVYNGYGDDPANTDNAWKETEIWNFHYKYKDNFDSFIKDNDMFAWMAASFKLPLPPSEYIAVMEALKIH